MATITVTSTADSGERIIEKSLRNAINARDSLESLCYCIEATYKGKNTLLLAQLLTNTKQALALVEANFSILNDIKNDPTATELEVE